MSITHIIFDLSEVLIAGLVGIENRISTTIQLSHNEILTAFGGPLLQQLCVGNLSEKEYFERIINQHRWNISVEFLKNEVRKNFTTVIPGMPELIEKLSTHYSLALHSDHAREWIDTIMDKHSFLQYFQHTFFSFNLKEMKTSARVFKKVAHNLHVLPSQCLFIDDKISNIAHAQEAGMNAILFTSASMLKEKLHAAPYHLEWEDKREKIDSKKQ